jgi:type I restriction enzyme R subunit
VFSVQEPIRQDLFKCLENKTSILKARAIGKKIILKNEKFIAIFVTEMTG